MKKAILIFSLLLSVSFMACNNNKKDERENHEHTAMYACPMHSDVISDEPSSCRKCGMDLEAVED